MSNVDAICVWTVPWCIDGDTGKCQVLAPKNIKVKQFAVLGSDVLDDGIVDKVEGEILQFSRSKTTKIN